MRLIERFSITTLAARHLSGPDLKAFYASQTELARSFNTKIEAARLAYHKQAQNIAWSKGGAEFFAEYMERHSRLSADLKRNLARALLACTGRA